MKAQHSHPVSPGIAPFYLYANPRKPWLDAVYLTSTVMRKYVTIPRGYVFRKKLASGFFSQDIGQSMVSAAIF